MRYKTALALAGAVALAAPTRSKGQIVQYNFSNGGATNVSLATMETATSVDPNASAGSITLGSAVNTTTDEGSAVAGYWTSPTPDYLSVSKSSTVSATDDTNFYVQFSVSATPGYVLDPSSLTFTGGSGGGSTSANERSYYVFDSNDGLPSGAGDLTGTGNGPYATNTNGTLISEGKFDVYRNGGFAMDNPTINFPADDTNLASFTVRVYFDTQTVSQNIDLGSFTLNGSVVTGAPNSTWTSNTSGDFNNAANWSAGTPNYIGATANFAGAIGSNNVVYTTSSITLGTLVFNNSAASYSLTGAVNTSLTLQTASGNALVDDQAGTQQINIPLVIASNTTLQTDTASASLVIANPVTINSGITLTTAGSGSVIFNSIINVGSNATFNVANSTHAAALNLASNATAVVSAPVLEVDNLSNLGTLNLQNNEMIVNYAGGADPISSIVKEIVTGFNNGSWTGAGITSSTAQSNSNYGIGYADAADPGDPAGLSSGQIELRYTLLGDANLDGKVNGADFTLMAANFNHAVTNGWDAGDFNYDGSVNGSDFVLLADNFNQFASESSVDAADLAALSAFAASNGINLGSGASVPEPASLGLLAVGAAALLGRRRKTNHQKFNFTREEKP